MTPAQLAYLIRKKTGATENSYSNTNMLVDINIFIDDFAKEIAKANEDIFGMRFTRNLVADRREYGIPDEILNNLKYVEAKLNGTDQKHLTPFDLNTYKRPTDEENIINNFTDVDPKYDIFRRSLWIYSGSAIQAVTGGLILWAIIYPAHLTDLTSTIDMATEPSTTSHGFPRQFHELLARRVAMEYKSDPNRNFPFSDLEQRFKEDFADAIEAISNSNLDNVITGEVAYNDGQQY